MKIWALLGKSGDLERAKQIQEKLRRYPRPFRVGRFVDKYEVHDANHSECLYMHEAVLLGVWVGLILARVLNVPPATPKC